MFPLGHLHACMHVCLVSCLRSRSDYLNHICSHSHPSIQITNQPIHHIHHIQPPLYNILSTPTSGNPSHSYFPTDHVVSRHVVLCTFAEIVLSASPNVIGFCHINPSIHHPSYIHTLFIFIHPDLPNPDTDSFTPNSLESNLNTNNA